MSSDVPADDPTSYEKWLINKPDKNFNKTKFSYFEFIESCKLSEKAKNKLISHLINSKVHPRLLTDYVKEKGWEEALKVLVKTRQPTKKRMKRGDFGEVLNTTLLLNHFNYVIPVFKLRFKITKNQSLPGTDTVVIRINDEKISELCYVESKLRTSTDNYLGVEGYKQLQKDYDEYVPAIITFILNILADRNDPLYYTFFNYLIRRDDLRYLDKFILGIVIDEKNYSDKLIDNILECDKINEYPSCQINVIIIDNMINLINDIYEKLGVIPDD